jgi:hypothetical protein
LWQKNRTAITIANTNKITPTIMPVFCWVFRAGAGMGVAVVVAVAVAVTVEKAEAGDVFR